ncbi:Chorismate synthase [Bienertia sinuspersici]
MEKSRSYPNYGKFEFQSEDNDNEMKSSSTKAYNFNGPTSKSSTGFSTNNDPESKRKRRVASYNMFTVEGKLKSSMKSSFKWIKNKFADPKCEIFQD